MPAGGLVAGRGGRTRSSTVCCCGGFREAGEDCQVLWLGFREADAGIEDDAGGINAGGSGEREAAEEKSFYVFDDIARSGAELRGVVHEDRGGAVAGDHPGHGGVALKSVNVVDDVCTGGERGVGDGGVVGVD